MAYRINLTFEEKKSPRLIKMPLSLNKRFEIDEMTQLARQQNKMDSSFSKMIDLEHSASSVSMQSSATTSAKCNCYRPFMSSTPEKICCSLCPCDNIYQSITENSLNISSVEKLESFMDQQEDYSEINELDRTLVNNSHSIFMEDESIIISNQNNDTESTLTDCYMEITATSE